MISMTEVIWDDRFRHLYRKWVKQHPDLKDRFRETLLLFDQDPFHPSLRTHSLSGELKGLWSFRITYHYRLVFAFLDESHGTAILIDIGSHEEVY
jgi:addiction module RelE/StbE family toxin